MYLLFTKYYYKTKFYILQYYYTLSITHAHTHSTHTTHTLAKQYTSI